MREPFTSAEMSFRACLATTVSFGMVVALGNVCCCSLRNSTASTWAEGSESRCLYGLTSRKKVVTCLWWSVATIQTSKTHRCVVQHPPRETPSSRKTDHWCSSIGRLGDVWPAEVGDRWTEEVRQLNFLSGMVSAPSQGTLTHSPHRELHLSKCSLTWLMIMNQHIYIAYVKKPKFPQMDRVWYDSDASIFWPF